ncbi:hypothetical protein BH09GEM1_BH09GEM1_16830 [soil metagenome]
MEERTWHSVPGTLNGIVATGNSGKDFLKSGLLGALGNQEGSTVPRDYGLVMVPGSKYQVRSSVVYKPRSPTSSAGISEIRMFESFRQSLNDILDRATPPEERRAVLTRMKQTLVQARMGLDDLRGGVTATRQRLDVETRELETMRRRKAAALTINDVETLALAEKYETLHGERAEVLRKKLEAQEAELGMVDREVAEMTAELKTAMLGAGGGSSSIADEARAEADAVLDHGSDVAEEIDAISRAGRRSARESEAEQKLAELKRRMGK